MAYYRKKPDIFEAMLLTWADALDVQEWCGGKPLYDPSGKMEALGIATLEGTMRAEWGDYVIRGVKGEFYPCKPDIFEATYDPVRRRQLGLARCQFRGVEGDQCTEPVEGHADVHLWNEMDRRTWEERVQ